ncbi:LacI family DNA-binding transcriptional regulator [Acidipila sp. EB88]|uniref:LacI family DNA-binding transcriptional regulator n=1 Tax=Acidipila sp. EB88 TaxID=2305226 RepID=UPI000F5D66B6|nr:LacI family DNA-binding transcriptional regulator [Acidipila sp. EB88]RRA47162.1 LacI family transcriptional regulator [Acidipila sp. EB88]
MNMKFVALRAGVSSATVSRVINGSPLVKPETAEHVRRIIAGLNFIPNPLATTLKYGRSRTYGLIIPDITNPFYPEFLRDFEEILVGMDHEVLLANVRSSPEALVHSIRRMLLRQVDGVVLMASEFDTKVVEPLLARKVPLVTIDRRRAGIGTSDVSIDFEDGFAQAVAHLFQLGHRRIAFVGGSEGLRTSRVRLEAFQQGLARSGLTLYPELLHAGNYRVDGGEAAIHALLQTSDPPTAVMTANDLTAFGVMRGLHRAGVTVPHSMSVVGADDVLLSDILQPPLTTIHVSRREMAAACVEALEYTKEHLDGRGRHIRIGTLLLVRETTARPRDRHL